MARALYIVAALLLASTAAATWTSLCTKNSQCPTMMMGISCKDESLCAIAGGYSNTPMGVYYSQNGFSDGKFTLSKMDGDSAMIMDIAIDSSGAGATAGMGLLNNSAILYSENVMEWKTSTDISFMVGQDMVAFGNGEFGYVGEIDNTKNTQGVLISSDGGKDWNPSYWPKNLSDFTQARYGAFPSDKVMYVSGGHWPSNRAELDINCYRLSAKTCVPSLKRNTRTAFNRDAGSQSTYYAVLTKSSDGGKTWEKQFSHSGSFYFNDIDCYDENTCFAVGEGFTDGGNPGARIYGTTDGGKTWTRVYFSTATGASLMRVHMLSKTEAWAAGGDVKDGVAQGTFYHTTDGGKTWSLSGTAEYVGDVMGLHFTSPSTGYAVGITQFQTSTLLKFSSSTATQ